MPLLQDEDRRHDEGDSDEADAPRGPPGRGLARGLGERAHRGIERARRRPGESDHVGQIEKIAGDVEKVDLGEHVERVADEHRRQRGDEETIGGAPLAARAEGDLQRDDEQEERDRRVARKDQLHVHRRAAAREDRLDHVHEREGEDGERGDDAVVDDPEAVDHRPRAGADDPDERRAKERVPRQDDEIGDERTVDGKHAEGVQVVTCDAADDEQREGTERHPPRRTARRAIAMDAEDDGTDRAGSGQSEGDLTGRTDQRERDQCRPDRPDDEVTPRDDEYP